MEEKKSTYLNFILMFFLSYSFYTIQILTQYLFKYYSKQSVSIICLFYILSPLLVYIACKTINKKSKKKSIKNNLIFSILSSLYLAFTTIISIVYVSNIIILYYYQQTSIIILLIFLILPIIYTIIKGENNFFSLASIILIIYSLFKYSYLKNLSTIDIYPFYNILKIDKAKLLPITLLSAPILLEPLILINNQKNISNKINIKFSLIFSIILSIIGIITILRQTWEFGALLDEIRFPYLESAKNIVAGKFFENIDYYYLLSIAVSIYTRLGYTLISIKQSFNLNKITTLTILFIIVIIVYFLYCNLQLGELVTPKILQITSLFLLILLFILPFMIRRKKNNV